MKKPTIATLHQAYFKEYGKIRFDDFPFDKTAFEQALQKALPSNPDIPNCRNLWRRSPPLQALLLRKIAPLAADLLSQTHLRLLCDQWLPTPLKAPLDTLFGYHPILCIVSISDAITFYHPSMPCPPDETYFALFGFSSTRYIKKPTDPANHLLKRENHTFGDLLQTETHPLIYFT